MDGRVAAATLAERIASWSSALDLGAVPDEVIHAARRCIVDVVGVSLGGCAAAADAMRPRGCPRRLCSGCGRCIGLSRSFFAGGRGVGDGTAGRTGFR